MGWIIFFLSSIIQKENWSWHEKVPVKETCQKYAKMQKGANDYGKYSYRTVRRSHRSN